MVPTPSAQPKPFWVLGFASTGHGADASWTRSTRSAVATNQLVALACLPLSVIASLAWAVMFWALRFMASYDWQEKQGGGWVGGEVGR